MARPWLRDPWERTIRALAAQAVACSPLTLPVGDDLASHAPAGTPSPCTHSSSALAGQPPRVAVAPPSTPAHALARPQSPRRGNKKLTTRHRPVRRCRPCPGHSGLPNRVLRRRPRSAARILNHPRAKKRSPPFLAESGGLENACYQSVSRSGVAVILWMERSAPLNSSSGSRRNPIVARKAP